MNYANEVQLICRLSMLTKIIVYQAAIIQTK